MTTPNDREMAEGDRIHLTAGKKPYPLVEIIGFRVEGCQLHGEPIEKIIVQVIESGHGYKKGCHYILNKEDL